MQRRSLSISTLERSRKFLVALAITSCGLLGEVYGADCSGLAALPLRYTDIASVKLIPAGPYIPPRPRGTDCRWRFTGVV